MRVLSLIRGVLSNPVAGSLDRVYRAGFLMVAARAKVDRSPPSQYQNVAHQDNRTAVRRSFLNWGAGGTKSCSL